MNNQSLTTEEVDEARYAEQMATMDEVALRATSAGYDDLQELSGFEDEYTRRLIQARNYLRKGKVATLKPLLPLLLQLKGKPYKLTNHFPFEPFFRTRMSLEGVYKCARQVSKSTSLAARLVVLSNSIPYFSTLVVAPLFEMIRRFSHNFVRQFIESSPVKRLFTDSSTSNNVLQRSFKNGASITFSYAFLDAERTRGIPADECDIDESCCATTTYVKTPTGCKLISSVKPGESIASFTKHGTIVWKRVITSSYHGYHHTFKTTLASGRSIVTTAETWLATTKDWQRVSDIIERTNTNATGDIAGGRLNAFSRINKESQLCRTTRLETASIQLSQIPNITRVRNLTSREKEELRLRKMVESFLNNNANLPVAYQESMLQHQSRWQDYQNNHYEMATQNQRPGSSMVGMRRWQLGSRRCEHDTAYRRIFEIRSEFIKQLVAKYFLCGEQCLQNKKQIKESQMVLDNWYDSNWHSTYDRTNRSVHSGMYDLQGYYISQDKNSDLFLVWQNFHSCGWPAETNQSSNSLENETMLSGTSMSKTCSPGTKSKNAFQTWQTRSQERQTTRDLQSESRNESRNRTFESSQTQKGKSGTLSRIQKTVACHQSSHSSTTYHNLRKLRSTIRDKSTSQSPLLFDTLQENSNGQKQEEICLEQSEIVSIEYAGKRHVWDIEVEDTHAYIANGMAVHNCQDLNYDFLQIIHETLSGSPWAIKRYTGTPKSLDNTMEKLWSMSSQAEWMIKCQRGGCNHWNVPALNWDLYDMIGPWHSGISEENPGIICAKCSKPVNPRLGRWVHANPERRWSFAGYHVPQIIMPMHYAYARKWDELIGKMKGRNNTTPTTFLNEVCGESCDTGAKLITQTDLKNAAILPWPNKANQAKKHIKKYIRRILAVDWGGGGGKLSNTVKKTGEQQRLRTSFTTLAVLGMLPDGKIDIIWGHRSLRTHDFEYEARLCIEALSMFECSHIAHDYSGAGEGRLILLYQGGVPPTNITNISYLGPAKHNIMNFTPATDDNPHDIYFVDKPRSLVTTCMCLKYGLIRSFAYDYESPDKAGLLHDFLALIEEKIDSRIGVDIYTVVRNPNATDDFAQAVNMGCCTLWWMTKKWPNIAQAAKLIIPSEVLKYVHPVAKPDWLDM